MRTAAAKNIAPGKARAAKPDRRPSNVAPEPGATEPPKVQPLLYRRKHLPAVLGYGRTKVDEIVAHRDFPQPITPTPGDSAKAWVVTEVSAWIARRAAARDAGEKPAVRKAANR